MSERMLAVGVLCIQGAFIEHIRMLQRVAEEFVKTEQTKILIVEVRKPSHLADLDGLIIPGGESTTLSVFLKKNEFEETLKSWIFNEKRPGIVWGTCAGLIMLSDDVAGQKQGGQITVRQGSRLHRSSLNQCSCQQAAEISNSLINSAVLFAFDSCC